MRYASFSEEKKLWKAGYKKVACLDEAGRGPLAGPVVAAAVMISRRPDLFHQSARSGLNRIKDSKQLTPLARENFYQIIIQHPNLEWGIGVVSEKVIDKINILEATKLAMKKAISDLELKLSKVRPYSIDFLILDGKMAINSSIPQKSIVKADEKVFSCACASILAKVTRDRLMMRYHKRYPKYRFDLHKGYPTKLHRAMLEKYGLSKIHRKTFKSSLII